MVSVKTDLPSYFDSGLVILAFAFWCLLISSTLKLVGNWLTYGRQRGIVIILTPIYLITLLANAFNVLLLIFHEIEIHAPFYRQDNIENTVRIIGSYIVLWLNFIIDCLILSCWIKLFADLFGFASPQSCLKRYGEKKFIYALLIFSAIYLIFIIIGSILIEIVEIKSLNMAILSYLHFVPIIINIVISLSCLCKLPLAQVTNIYIFNIFISLHNVETLYKIYVYMINSLLIYRLDYINGIQNVHVIRE